MKYNRKMPEGESIQTFRIMSEGEHKLQITDIFSESEEKIVVKCETLSEATTILYSVAMDTTSKFYWLTKLFLKCIGEPHNGDVEIDTDAWIGRQFTGKIVHTVKGDKTYANVRELIYKDEVQPVKSINPGNVTKPEDIDWGN